MTVKKLLQTGLLPMGSTMYVWGGGWNEEDTGAGKEARSLGVSSRWSRFFQMQAADYDYRRTRFQIHDGLDCSGYMGWCLYNLLETENGRPGYVMPAARMAEEFTARGFGTFCPAVNVRDYRAGDLMCSSGHVYLVAGPCADGSIVLMHASPPGVQLSGTVSPAGILPHCGAGGPAAAKRSLMPEGSALSAGGKESQAAVLADFYMKRYFPQWYQNFPPVVKGLDYLQRYSRMRWDISGRGIISDPDGLTAMCADEVLKVLFEGM